MRVIRLLAGAVLAASLLHPAAWAADRPATAAEVEKLHDQVRALDKDLSVHKEVSAARLEAQDKRLADLGLAAAQQSNQLSAIANQTATVGNYIAATSIGITLIVFLAGFFTYFSAKNRAEAEARLASRAWFDENAADLLKQRTELESQTKAASEAIGQHQEKIARQAQEASASIDKSVADAILRRDPTAGAGAAAAPVATAAAEVDRVDEQLKSKPEVSFTPEDHYARGLARFAKGNYESALESFDAALSAASAEAGSAMARYLFARGVTLGALDRPKDEIAVYEEIDRRYGQDAAPALREQVAKALNGRGFTGIMLAKQHWSDKPVRQQRLDEALVALQRASGRSSDEDRATILGNVGYCLFLRGRREEARAPTLECLRLGGEKSLAAQREDARRYRVEPEDSEYEDFLTALWNEGQRG